MRFQDLTQQDQALLDTTAGHCIHDGAVYASYVLVKHCIT